MTDRVHFDDLTAIHAPIKLLDEDTFARLESCGGPYQVLNSGGVWAECAVEPVFAPHFTYRQSPGSPLLVHDWPMLADWVMAVTRSANGSIWGHAEANLGTNSSSHWFPYRSAPSQVADLWVVSPRLIDPGTCHWTKAIAKRPGNDLSRPPHPARLGAPHRRDTEPSTGQ